MKSNSQQSILSSSQNQLSHINNHFNNNNNNNNGSSSVKSTHHSNDQDIMNYQTLINKLAKGSINDKAIAIKKLLFLYEHSRARIYLYQRRIVQSLELSLLIQQKQVSLSGLTLLQKILTNASTSSQIGSIFQKKLLSKVVLNLGSSDINVRKISHKCVHEYIRKFKDYQAVVTIYIKTALKPQLQQQSTTKHLKLKAINSLHSLLMAQNKPFRIDQQYSLNLIQQLITSSYQKEFIQIRRAALICLICVLKIQGSQNTLKLISMKTQNQLYQLRMQSQQLASLLQMIMKHHLVNMKNNVDNTNEDQSEDQEECISSQNAPSPKFISIQQSQVLIQKPPKTIDQLPKSIEHIAKSLQQQKLPSKSIEYSNNQQQQQHKAMIQQQPQYSLPRSVDQIQQKLIIPTLQHHSLSQLQPQPHQLKIFNEVSYAQQFLKKLQRISFSHFSSQSLDEIKSFAPFLEKYLVDESIKLFSISKKIVQVIFDSMEDNCILKESMNQSVIDEKLNKRKEVYVVVVPCVVKGIGNKRFIVRKNLDKLVRTYAKNHPDVWINNFLDRFVKTSNPKIKQILIDLFSYAYKSSPQFYYPVDKPFQIFDSQISNKNSTLRWKAIDCVILLIERQGKQTVIQEMLQKFSLDSYHKILRKLNKNLITTVSNQDRQIDINNEMIQIEVPTPVSNYKRKFKRNQRIMTDQNQKLLSIEKSQNNTDRNLSQQRKINLNKGLFFKDKQNKKSFIDYDLKQRRRTQKKSRQSKQRTSLQRLPELKLKTSVNSQSLSKNQLPQCAMPQSPVKKSFTQKNIMYTDKSQLQSFQDPKLQLQKALMTIKNSTNSWMSHFDSINKIRAVIENHSQLITQQHLQSIVNDLINCLNGNSRSGVMKISLICLDQLILKLKKRLYPYTQMIIQTILKKSISTSQFMADQLKKCIIICTQQLCANKIIPYINSLIKDSKNTQIKLNILLMIQTMAKQQKTYKKQSQSIWSILIQLHDQPQFQLRQQCKNIVKCIVQLYKSTWKQDVSMMKKSNLQKIDKILKNLNNNYQRNGDNNSSSSWLQQQGIQFQKILSSKGINSKYFTTEYVRFQQLDRQLMIRKNWKDRIKNINDVFNIAFQYSAQFQINLNARKYMSILCEHLDQKNPGQLLNALNILSRCIQVFVNSQLMQQVIGQVIQKYLLLLDTKRTQLITTYNKLITKLYNKYDLNRVIKQLVKLVINGGLKIKVEGLNQLIMLVMREQQVMMNNRRQQRESIPIIVSSNNHQQRSRQKLRNKENTLNKQLISSMQGANSIITNNTNSSKLAYNNMIGSQTPTNNNTSSHMNIPITNNCLSSLNSQNKHYNSQQRSSLNINNNLTSTITNSNNNNNRLSPLSMNMIMKMVSKLTNDKMYQHSNILNSKIKELVYYCNLNTNNRKSINNNNMINSNNQMMLKISNNLHSNQRQLQYIQ